MYHIKALFVAILLCILIPLETQGQSARYLELWQDPEVEQRIEDGIETHRKGWATLRFVDEEGEPVTDVDVQVEQTEHDFLFGANLFMAEGFDTPEQNRQYEEAFAEIFNQATLAFYMKSLQPEPGRLRFEEGSESIYRRPPTDVALERARAAGLTPKGHPLWWDSPSAFVPDWWPEGEQEQERLMRHRFERLAERYGEDILIWDVVNEVMARKTDIPMPDDYVFKAFDLADRLFPAESELLINETTGNSWGDYRAEYSPYYMLIENLLARDARIDAVGLQFHVFSEQLWEDIKAGEAMTPERLFKVMDLYAEFDRPLQVTEITIPTIPDTPEGEDIQAEVTRNFYRAWFSHPNMEAITWWNLTDDTAWLGEDRWQGGLMEKDFTPKPSYEVLDQLINEEWHTEEQISTGNEARAKFRGFYGTYDVTITHNGRTVQQEVHLREDGDNVFTIEL